MSEMVKRVATAIFECQPDDFGSRWEPDKQDYLLARAAIAAMRKPNLSMVYAGAATQEDSVAGNVGSALHVWQAMIDEALR